MLGVAVWPKSKNDDDKLSNALARMVEEDQTCRLVNNKETKENVFYGVGDQHIDVLVSKMRAKYKVEVNLTVPKVPYRETIKKTVVGEGRHKKQSGGHGQFGHVFVEFHQIRIRKKWYLKKRYSAVPYLVSISRRLKPVCVNA